MNTLLAYFSKLFKFLLTVVMNVSGENRWCTFQAISAQITEKRKVDQRNKILLSDRPGKEIRESSAFQDGPNNQSILSFVNFSKTSICDTDTIEEPLECTQKEIQDLQTKLREMEKTQLLHIKQRSGLMNSVKKYKYEIQKLKNEQQNGSEIWPTFPSSSEQNQEIIEVLEAQKQQLQLWLSEAEKNLKKKEKENQMLQASVQERQRKIEIITSNYNFRLYTESRWAENICETRLENAEMKKLLQSAYDAIQNMGEQMRRKDVMLEYTREFRVLSKRMENVLPVLRNQKSNKLHQRIQGMKSTQNSLDSKTSFI